MAQFDVYVNPVPNARRAYPFVVAMHADLAGFSVDPIVAPLAPCARMPDTAGRMMPMVSFDGAQHIVLVPRLTVLRSRDLKQPISSIVAARADLLTAIDYLFFGV